MKRILIFGLFVALALTQIAVPVGQIRKYEDILRTGAVYKFRTAPVDPYDAFRGRFVALNFADSEAALRRGEIIGYRAPAFVTLRKDAAGFVQFDEISGTPPAKGDFLRVEYLYTGEAEGTVAQFQLPFTRFYMEETQAPRAEVAYSRHVNRRDRMVDDVYVIVRIKDGRGVIEDLFVKGQPIRHFLAQEAAAD
jgi:uncharacterized membrane-anchored protein